MSDAVLTECPQCGKPAFSKQLTAAGFQLKGSGWYATDFKGGSSGASAVAATAATTTDVAPADTSTAKPDAPAAAAACSTGCACHS
jgi:hypothetical protein